MLNIGLDVGSTTLKCAVLGGTGEIIYKKYQRHYSQVAEKTIELLHSIKEAFPGERQMRISVSGSAGIGFAEHCGLPFVQEVYATKAAVSSLLPQTDVVIELGGEDAKILFLTGGTEVRMNGSCAGGTGAFVDQMATLLNISPTELNELASSCSKIYSIASRCGVFAKSDIQALLNQGAVKEDISASILSAVVNQTIAGLAQGREIKGNIVYLGGPLTFLSELRKLFDAALKTVGTLPDNSLYYVAIGSAIGGSLNEDNVRDIDQLIALISQGRGGQNYNGCRPLFKDENEYKSFLDRHNGSSGAQAVLKDGEGAYIGIDAGSTTVKAVVINEAGELVYSKYLPNAGNPVPLVKDFLSEVYIKYPNIRIVNAAATGYGEEIIKNAFHIDLGVVETVAHFTAAKRFKPEVDFIIDIGGQDIKCFKIKDGVIDDIFLNEACSSGCGSFLQIFAGALGYSVQDFAREGLFANKPVDLGSRCTVFMNSSVKQAQKEGASISNISAGLSISVVKNALYKVIRVGDPNSIGNHVVVQGGTFLNDAVLRAFEQEIGKEVTRPPFAGIMGAYGAALYARERRGNKEKSSVLSSKELESFTHKVSAVTCSGCTNRCMLTVNTFDGNRKFIGGNQCDKPLNLNKDKKTYNLYQYKKQLLEAYSSFEGKRETIGLPMGLNKFELLPFWHTFFKSLGFGVRVSPQSSKSLYQKGQGSIPSDTICYPAKLLHGHIEELMDSGVKTIFYPCMSYNVSENLGDNHFNCPIVAYYPEVIASNMKRLRQLSFINDYVGLHKVKDFPKKMHANLTREFCDLTLSEVKAAAKAAYKEYGEFEARIRAQGEAYLETARKERLPVIILSGRPYHLDGEINHGIDKLICGCGAVLISEDSLVNRYEKEPVAVLNQWTYHSRLYGAAHYIVKSGDKNLNLVQLVSFGCGLDAVTTDEVRRILNGGGRIYTQIKIDEITNLGAVRIRIRSLFAALNIEEV
jgi:predicted CoA-substrate-specific enzyme activase